MKLVQLVRPPLICKRGLDLSKSQHGQLAFANTSVASDTPRLTELVKVRAVALLQLVELELQRNPSSPAVRLDTSASVAAEVVAALRQGSAYVLPGDHRLLAAVKHQMDYLGVQLQPAAGEQNYLVVPTYDLASNAEAL
jgi:hypothetical protein